MNGVGTLWSTEPRVTVGTKSIRPPRAHRGLTSILAKPQEFRQRPPGSLGWSSCSVPVTHTCIRKGLQQTTAPSCPKALISREAAGFWSMHWWLCQRSGLWSLSHVPIDSIWASPLISGLCIGPLSVIKTFLWNGTWQESQVWVLCSWHGASTAPGLQRLVALGFALLCLLLEQHPSVTDWGFFFLFSICRSDWPCCSHGSFNNYSQAALRVF